VKLPHTGIGMLMAIRLEGMLIGELVWVDGVSISGEE
jgi:hypothetical protein